MPNKYIKEGGGPFYPEITEEQWSILSAMTPQRCTNMMEAMDFYSDLSPEAKAFLKAADKTKIEKLNAQLEFFEASKTIWRFIWIGGGMLLAVVVGFTQLWKTFGEWFTVKLK